MYVTAAAARCRQAPRVGGVKVYTDNIQRSEIIMDVEIFYAGDCRIECSFSRMSAGIKDFTVSCWQRGRLRG